MKKTFKVVMLPTEKATGLCKDKRATNYPNLLNHHKPNFYNELGTNDKWTENYHLYIISDDEIKEGDWYINTAQLPNKVLQHSKEGVEFAKRHNMILSKIVATTDKSLSYDAKMYGKAIEGYKQQLSQLPESFIQAYIKAYNEEHPITEVDLEMIETTFPNEEGIPNCFEGYEIKTRPDNTVIVHESKKYSRDEVLEFAQKYARMVTERNILNGYKLIHNHKWIEDNL